MLYLYEKSFWSSVLLIVVFYVKLCKPKWEEESVEYTRRTRATMTIRYRPPGTILDSEFPPSTTTTTTTTTTTKVTTPKSAAAQAAGDQQNRFTRKKTTTKKRVIRTTAMRISFEEQCDYIAHYCLKAYDTGKLCGRTLYYGYYTFRNYCLLDYVNCRERFEVWQVVHMGECYEIKLLTEYLLYPYDDDYFLEQYYIMEDQK